MIGSRLDPARPNTLIGRELDRMLRHLDAPVVMVRVKSGPRSDAARLSAGNGHVA
jgi:hypothetical protein